MNTPLNIHPILWYHTIFFRLFLGFSCLLLLSIAWSNTSTYSQMRRGHEQLTLQHLRDIRDSKSEAILDYINEQILDASILARQEAVYQALRTLSDTIDHGIHSPEYAAADAKIRPLLSQYLYTWAYHDIFLINPAGQIVFSIKHASDFNTNLLIGFSKDTPFAQLFERCIHLLQADNSTFFPYAPSSNQVSGFIMAPVIAKGKILGAVAFQLDISALDKVSNDLTGLGESGEIMLGMDEGNHKALITAPLRHDPNASFHRMVEASSSSDHHALYQAAIGNSGMGRNTDWRGMHTLAAWSYLPALQWGLVVKIDTSEVHQATHGIRRATTIIVLVVMLAALLLSILLARSITSRLHRLGRHGLQFAKGDYTVRADLRKKGRDEIGLLARIFNQMADEVQSAQIRIADTLVELQQTNRELDHQVEERTLNLQAVIDHAIDGIITLNEQGNVVSMNPVAKTILRCQSSDVINEPMHQWIPGWDTLDTRSNTEEKHMELLGLRMDGEQFAMDLSISRMLLEDQCLFLLTMRDLSIRKAREEQLSLLHAAVEHATDMVLISDQDNIIRYVNPAYEHITGYSATEAIGRTPNIIKSGKHHEKFYQSMWNKLTQGKSFHAIFTNQKKDGVRYEEDKVVAPIMDDAGKIRGFVSVGRDITERRKTQAKMEHRQRLESMGILAGGIAHDFNNILTAIMGNAALARIKMVHSDAEFHLERIEDSSRRAADLCKQMLAYSGKGKFVVVPINLSDLVEEITKLLEVSITKNIVVRYDLTEHLPSVEADAAQMQQVIMNLVINASDAISGKSGVISISTGVTQASKKYLASTYMDEALEPGRYVYLEVSDTGCGMNKATQKKLFDPFFTTKFTGRGLGMSAVLGIVRGHHGAMKVYSEEGRGTTFKMLLPLSENEATPTDHSVSPQDQWHGQGTVLIVDDEETIRETAGIMLENIGFDTLTACDGNQGVEIYREHQKQVVAVLLDMTMPKMDGVACFSHLREINPDVKVILSSGYNEQDATNRFAGKGLAGFLQKPYTPKQLKETIKTILD